IGATVVPPCASSSSSAFGVDGRSGFAGVGDFPGAGPAGTTSSSDIARTTRSRTKATATAAPIQTIVIPQHYRMRSASSDYRTVSRPSDQQRSLLVNVYVYTV